MPFLNLNFNLLIYEDTNNPKNPDIRLPDISKSIESVSVDFDKSERLSIYGNEIKDIATTQRNVLWDATTEIAFSRPISTENYIRLTYTGTGTAPVFRTNRNIGGAADTTVSISRVTDYVARIQNTAGTAWSLGSVNVNDFIRFDRDTDSFTSPFVEQNRGKEFLVQSVGADYIDFVDNGIMANEVGTVLGADYTSALRVLSQGQVKAGDIVQLSGATLNPSNHGKFEISDVTDNYIEIVNPLGVTQTLLIASNTFVIYEYLIGFVHLRASAPFKIRFGAQTEWVQIDRLGAEAVFIGSVCTHKIEALNDNPDTVTISVQHAMVTG